MDLKKFIKSGSNAVKDVTNTVKDELEKRKEDYDEQKKIREASERKEEEERKVLMMHQENEKDRLLNERLRIREEEQRRLMGYRESSYESEKTVRREKRNELSNDECYDILGVSKDASSSEITEAYKKKSLLLHPDRNASSKFANELMTEINEAYQTLQKRGRAEP